MQFIITHRISLQQRYCSLDFELNFFVVKRLSKTFSGISRTGKYLKRFSMKYLNMMRQKIEFSKGTLEDKSNDYTEENEETRGGYFARSFF